eukprot:PhM_4_TR7643/c0_g1_i1/m.44269
MYTGDEVRVVPSIAALRRCWSSLPPSATTTTYTSSQDKLCGRGGVVLYTHPCNSVVSVEFTCFGRHERHKLPVAALRLVCNGSDVISSTAVEEESKTTTSSSAKCTPRRGSVHNIAAKISAMGRSSRPGTPRSTTSSLLSSASPRPQTEGARVCTSAELEAEVIPTTVVDDKEQKEKWTLCQYVAYDFPPTLLSSPRVPPLENGANISTCRTTVVRDPLRSVKDVLAEMNSKRSSITQTATR